jgi:DNA-binding NtrC family response regulator
MKNKINLLALDDEENILWILKEGLENEEIYVFTASNHLDAENILQANQIDVCLIDIFLNDASGIELVEDWSEKFSSVHYIIMTAQNTSSNVIESMKAGAVDFYPKPFDLVEIKNKIMSLKDSKSKVIQGNDFIYDFQTENKKLLDIYKLIGRIAKTNINVLIQGETGTGKEVIAKMIHDKSDRADKPFIAINMAAVPKELIESELFGHTKGSFTGANTDKSGKFEQANGGTIFLDEISEMDLSLQSKLLRVIQEKEINRIGSSKAVKLDVRIIAATNIDLEQSVNNKEFREDLFYRLNVVSIELPTLSERKEDIETLTRHFLEKYKDIKNKVLDIDEKTINLLENYDWPGNIRELENAIQYSIVQADSDFILPENLPNKIKEPVRKNNGDSLHTQLYKLAADIIDSEMLTENFYAYEEYRHITEKPLVKAVLDKTGGNKSLSAKLLGINRNTLRKKIKDYSLE